MKQYTFRIDSPTMQVADSDTNIIITDTEAHDNMLQIITDTLKNPQYTKTFLTREIAKKSKKLHYHGIIETDIPINTLKSRFKKIYKDLNLTKSQSMIPQVVRNPNKAYDYFLKDLTIVYQKGYTLQEFTQYIKSSVLKTQEVKKSSLSITERLIRDYEPISVQTNLQGRITESSIQKALDHALLYVENKTIRNLYSRQNTIRYVQTLMNNYYKEGTYKERQSILDELINIYT